jgi:cobalt-zinc-cadmium efflux system outer membrane protein
MSKRILTFYLLLIGVATIRTIHGERDVDSASSVTADGLVAEALAKNPELNYYRAEIKAARGERRTAGEWANPEVTTDAGAKIVNDSSGNSLGQGATWSISAAQTFEYPGRVSLRKAIANQQISLAEIGLEGFEAALAARVRALALRVIVTQEKATVARKVSDRFQELISVLSQRATAGVAPLLDTRLIEANAIALNRRTAENARDLRSAIYEVNQLRGSPIDAALQIAKSDLKFPPLLSLAKLLSLARSNSYDVRLSSPASDLFRWPSRPALAPKFNARWLSSSSAVCSPPLFSNSCCCLCFTTGWKDERARQARQLPEPMLILRSIVNI